MREAAAGEFAAIGGGVGEIAAVAQNARAAAFAALDAQLGDVEARALQLGAQYALLQVDAVEHRQHAQIIGGDVALPLRVGTVTADGGVGLQRAAHAPAGWGEQRPDADVGHLGVNGAGQRCLFGERPLAVLLRELRVEIGGGLACAFAVPQQLGVDLAALRAHVEARVLDARAHACAIDLARRGLAARARAARADHGRAFTFAVDGQAQVACSAFDGQ